MPRRPERQFYVYIMTNPNNTVLYTGVTGDLQRRVFQHREKLLPGFTATYNAVRLVYYEAFADPLSAIEREKQFKAGPRRKKIEAIERMNPGWRDLYEGL